MKKCIMYFYILISSSIFLDAQEVMSEVRKLSVLANQLEIDGKYKESIETYKKIIKLNKNNISNYTYDALYLIGHIYFKLKRYDMAVEYYKKAVNLAPNKDIAYEHLALVYIKMNDLKQSISIFETFFSKFGFNKRLAHFVMPLYAREKRWTDVVSIAKKILELEPTDPDALGHLALINIVNGDEEQAKKYFTQAAKAMKKSDIDKSVKEMFFHAKQYLKSIKEQEKQKNINPKNPKKN